MTDGESAEPFDVEGRDMLKELAAIDELSDLGDGVGSAAGDGGEGEEDAAVDEVAGLTAERDGYLDSLRRLQADFDNYRKRSVRQQTEMLERASESLLVQLLPVLDAFDLAAAHKGSVLGATGSPGATAGTAAGVARGAGGARSGETAEDDSLGQIGGLLRTTLEREGLERIDAVGVPFDPTIHDAVAHEDAPAGEPLDESEALGEAEDEVDRTDRQSGPTIAEILRAGYRLKGRVIRPAMVKVRG